MPSSAIRDRFRIMFRLFMVYVVYVLISVTTRISCDGTAPQERQDARWLDGPAERIEAYRRWPIVVVAARLPQPVTAMCAPLGFLGFPCVRLLVF